MKRFQIRLIFFFLTAIFPIFGDEWKTVYLASFPRSGNHWVRFLLEEATHIATSSIYEDDDFPHFREVFPWGGYCTDHGYDGHCRYPTKEDPVILKTHYPYYQKKIDPEPKITICLIRNPIDAFWSLYVYRQNDPERKINQQKLKKFIARWRMFYEFWEQQPGVLFIRYEDLQKNTRLHLHRILQTAGFSFDQTDIERAVAKYPSKGKSLKHIQFYDNIMIETIKNELSDLLTKFQYDL